MLAQPTLLVNDYPSLRIKIETNSSNIDPRDPPERFDWRLAEELALGDKSFFEAAMSSEDESGRNLYLPGIVTGYRVRRIPDSEWMEAESLTYNPVRKKIGF